MTWLTCGSVESVEINAQEGGVTTHRGGLWCCITPGGYLGSATVGALLVIAAGSPFGALVASAVLFVLLVFVVCKASKALARITALVALVLIFVTGLLALLSVDERAFASRFLAGFAGVINLVFALYDIVDDTIRRDLEKSDANTCAEHLPCISGRCVGCCWFVCALACTVAAVFVSVLVVVPIDDTAITL